MAVNIRPTVTRDKQGRITQLDRILKPGTVLVRPPLRAAVYLHVQYGVQEHRSKDELPQLTISGVVGPTRSGDALGGSGQCLGTLKELATLTDGWTPETVSRLHDVWDTWHLNALRAGCPHQRAAGWGQKKLRLVTYKLTAATLKAQHTLKATALHRLIHGEVVQLSLEDQGLLALPFSCTLPGEEEYAPLRALLSEHYAQKEEDTKYASQVYEQEHPEGVLSKPCPECQYPYGTAWLYEAVPSDVLEFLATLPVTTTVPAWV